MTRKSFEVPELIPGEEIPEYLARVRAEAEACGWVVKSVTPDEIVIAGDYGQKA